MIIRTEYEISPLGTDVRKPHFSWIGEGLRKNYLQESFRIVVKDESGELFWDSEETESQASFGILYGGKPLKACTSYHVMVQTKGTCLEEDGSASVSEDEGETTFETGLMCSDETGFEGAKWIAAPEKYLSSDRIGVFVLDADLTIEEGFDSAGVIFGADDERLMNKDRNIYGLSGENYIAYELNVKDEPCLKIYRVGYAPGDLPDVPFSVTPLYPFREHYLCRPAENLITKENMHLPHHLKIEVSGNGAYAYLDGVLVDAKAGGMLMGMLLKDTPREQTEEVLVKNGLSFDDIIVARTLNPLGGNDVITFPRLYRAGYYVPDGSRASFGPLRISNLREPKHEIRTLFENGLTLDGKEGRCVRTEDPSSHALPMFRTDFSVLEKPVKKARLYITSHGIYDVRINGQRVTKTFLNPGLTQYDKRINYQTYDITGLLKPSENGIGVLLASGWFTDAQTFTVRNYNYFGDTESFIAKLVISYEDGEKEVIVTDPETWTYYGEGPVVYAGNFQGETIDGRKTGTLKMYSLPGCPLKSASGPVEALKPETIPESYANRMGREWPEINFEKPVFQGQYQSPVFEEERLTAKDVFSPRPGLYVYDLQQEIAGIPVIRFRGKAGERAVIRYAEMLYPDLPEYAGLSGMILTENYRDAESTDYYILRGDEDGEVFMPEHTFHGYRYIEISGVENPPGKEEVESLQLSSVRKITGDVSTSDPLLNRLVKNVRYSMLSNFISIPTDCPQRNERMGWAGDTHIFAKTATYLSDMQLFYYKYLEAISDLQKENGEMPMIAPVGGGFGGITYECAMILIANELYLQYGDTDVLLRFYPAMMRWMRHMEEIGMPGNTYVGPINDWLAFDATDNGIVWNAFYLHAAALMEKFARVLKKEQDRAYFEERTRLARDWWNAQYLDKETGLMHGSDGSLCDTQCAYALGLAYDCFEEKDRARAAEHLLRKVRESGYTIRTGFFGTPLLAPMLSDAGYSADAFKLVLSREFPSWLYPVTQGATTIWERWNSYTKENGFGGNNSMNSFNHYSYGAVLSWLIENAAGIRRDEFSPGYRHFRLMPEIAVLDRAEASVPTPCGQITSGWERKEDGISYHCIVPENTSAELVLRSSGNEIRKQLFSGEYTFFIR